MQQTKEKTWFQILVILTVTIGGLCNGAIGAWSSPYMLKIVEDDIYDITEEQASYFAVIGIVGMVIMTPLLVPIIELLGKKKSLILSGVPVISAWLIKAFCTGVWYLYLSRLLAGVGDAFTIACIPMYIGEIASPQVRGVWGNSFIISVYFGSFLINLLGIYYSVKTTALLFAAIETLFIISLPFLPESPYFLISKGKEAEAEHSLKRLRRVNDISNEFTEMKACVKEQMALAGSWKDLLNVRLNRKAFGVAVFLRAIQVFTGTTIFFGYIQFIFAKAGTNLNAGMSSIIYTGLNVIIYSSVAYGSNKLGRRKSLMTSLALTCCVFSMQGVYFLIDAWYPEINLEKVQWFPLVGMIAFLVFSSFGVGTIPTLMQSELFPANIKSKGVAGVSVFFGLSNVGYNNLFYYLNLYIGLFVPFFVFASCSALFLILTYFILPETKNKTLAEIQETLEKM